MELENENIHVATHTQQRTHFFDQIELGVLYSSLLILVSDIQVITTGYRTDYYVHVIYMWS